jgi:AmiR/NasT family two-component response regulator
VARLLGAFGGGRLPIHDDVFNPAALSQLTTFSEVAAGSFMMASELRTALATVGQLRNAMQGRTSIDVACGVIMGQNRCSYQDAFQILAKASSHRNVKARVVAETILGDLPGGPPSTHFKG